MTPLEQSLRRSGVQLDVVLRAHILELGSAAIPWLIGVLEDDTLLQADEDHGAWAPSHATELLGDLAATEAIEPMIRVLARIDVLDPLQETLEETLMNSGQAGLEPLLYAHAHSDDFDVRRSLCFILARLQIQDERIFECLLDQLSQSLECAAGNLAAYDDSRALPFLSRALDTYELDLSGRMFANHAMVELRAAIVELGGSLSSEQEQKYQRSRQPALDWAMEMHSLLGLLATEYPEADASQPTRDTKRPQRAQRKRKKRRKRKRRR